MECILAKPNRCLINVTTSLVNYRIYVTIYPSDKGNIFRIVREFISMAQFMESMENDAILFFLVEKKYIRLMIMESLFVQEGICQVLKWHGFKPYVPTTLTLSFPSQSVGNRIALSSNMRESMPSHFPSYLFGILDRELGTFLQYLKLLYGSWNHLQRALCLVVSP